MTMFTRALVAGLALCLCVAVAQEKPQAKGKPAAKAAQQQAHTSMEPMVAPSPEMKKLLKTLAGTWTAEEKHEAMGDMPAGTSTGSAVFRPGPGRLSLVEDYKANMPGMGRFTGLGVTWWDPAAKAYTALWCDSGTPSGCATGGTGKWEGNDLVFTGDMDMNGQKHTMKSTYTNIKPDSVDFNMEVDGKPAMTIKYKKMAAKP